MPHEITHADGYTISDDQARFDLDRAHRWISQESYWAKGVPRDTFVRSVAGSLTVGAYASDRAMVGMARVVTDRATFAWLCDVFVNESGRGAGIGKKIVAYVKGHPDLQGLRRMHLATADAHGLYAQYGFKPLTGVDRWMEIVDREVYSRGAPSA